MGLSVESFCYGIVRGVVFLLWDCPWGSISVMGLSVG